MCQTRKQHETTWFSMEAIVDLILDLDVFDCPSHERDTERNADMIDHIWGHTRIKVLDGAKPVALIHTGLKSHPAQRSIEEKTYNFIVRDASCLPLSTLSNELILSPSRKFWTFPVNNELNTFIWFYPNYLGPFQAPGHEIHVEPTSFELHCQPS